MLENKRKKCFPRFFFFFLDWLFGMGVSKSSFYARSSSPCPFPSPYTRTSKTSAHVKINLLNTLSTILNLPSSIISSFRFPFYFQFCFFVCILAFSIYFFFFVLLFLLVTVLYPKPNPFATVSLSSVHIYTSFPFSPSLPSFSSLLYPTPTKFVNNQKKAISFSP